MELFSKSLGSKISTDPNAIKGDLQRFPTEENTLTDRE